jgi:hypothetical protein
MRRDARVVAAARGISVDRKYSQIEELLWLYQQRVLINAQIGGPLFGVIRTLT